MKTLYIFASFLIIFLLNSCGKADTPVEISQNPEVQESFEEKDFEGDNSEGVAEEDIIPVYSDFENTGDGGTDEKILFFSSESCESCKIADANLQEEDSLKIFSDIIKIDFDSESSFKERFEVTQPHTFVLMDENENLIKKIEGAMNSQELTKLYE